jgi:hypothetical protein
MRQVFSAVIRHPRLWLVALVQAIRLARPDWWRRWPPIPGPSDDLWRLRMLTAYGGDGSAPPDPGDVVSYLDWCSASRSWRNR